MGSAFKDTFDAPAHEAQSARLVSTLIEISELYHCRTRIVSPRYRLHALAALIPTARQFGMRTTVMEQEVTACLEWATARCRLRSDAPAVIARLLPRCFDAGLADLAQLLARTLFLPRFRAETFLVRTLAGAGWTGEAERFAAGLVNRHLRYRLTRLAGSERSAPDQPSTGSARQRALADATVESYRGAGLAEAVKVHRAIRYQSVRKRAWYLVLGAALDGGRLEDAWRVLEHMRPGAHRERARLRLAAELVRRGRPRRARRLLSGSFGAARRVERDLLLAEIRLGEGDVGRVSYVLKEMAGRLLRRYEDLAQLDSGVPALPGRCAVLALRLQQAQEGRRGYDPRALARRTLDVHDPNAVRLLLAAAADGLLDLGRAVEALGRYAYDPIHSQWICERARHLREGASSRPVVPKEVAEAFTRGLRCPSDDLPEAWRRREANDPARCAYDEGISLSRHAGRYKRVLVHAAKASLKAWLRDPPAPPGAPAARYVLAPRLRTLLNLGGKLAAEQLRRALAGAEAPTPAYLGAMSALIALDPEGAAKLYFGRHAGMLLADRTATLEIVGSLELRGVLEPGFTNLWSRLLGILDSSLGHSRAGRWLDQLNSAWLADAKPVPGIAALDLVLSEITDRVPASGRDVVTRARERVRRLVGSPPMQLVKALIRDPSALRKVAWLMPNAFPSKHGAWSPDAWQDALHEIRDGLGRVDASMVFSWARLLAPHRTARFLARCWLRGSSPLPKRLQTRDLPAEAAPSPDAGWRLRYLDKRRDFLTHLRFADCVFCCFHSGSSWYWRMQPWVLSVWKDPLSFCFHVERRPRGQSVWGPRGFVFGSFGVVYRSRSARFHEPAAILNGVYLRKQRADLRAAVLETIEETFCRPLGLRWVGIANRHGGHGELPDSYVARNLDFVRWRALKRDRSPVTTVYDDVTTTVNRVISEEHIYWRRLPSL